jgi:predicted HTH domain antitoxin
MGKAAVKALLEEVRARHLGYGKAAELAGIPLARFLALMGKHHITPFDYDDDELSREIGAGSRRPT